MSASGVRQLICRAIVALVVFSVLFTPYFTKAVYGQTDAPRFENISTEQGLSEATVNTILQDRQGFLWFGTEGGLNKYDGYQFTVYKHNPDDPKSLSDNTIFSMYEGQNGELWIGTNVGLDQLDRKTDTFIHYSQSLIGSGNLTSKGVLSIFQDQAGILWVGTEGGGLDALDLATNRVTEYRHHPEDPQSLSNDSVNSIYINLEGEIWIGTDAGLDQLDRVTGSFSHYLQASMGPPLDNVPVRTIYQDGQDRMWIGTRDGLVQWDRASNRFVFYQHDPNDPDSLSDNSIRCIVEDSRGVLWIGTLRGLNQLDKTQNRIIRFSHNPNDTYSLSSDYVRSIFEDRSGVLWIGTSHGGLNKYARSTHKFTLFSNHPGLPNNLSDNNIWSVYEDHSDNLWIGTFFSGLNKLNLNSGNVTIYQNDPSNPTSISNNEIRAILQDQNGFLWIGTEHGGLNRYDPRTDTFLHYQHDINNPTSLSSDLVFSIYEDHLGRLWIGTEQGGLNRFDQTSGTFIHYQNEANDPLSLSDNNVRVIYEDHAGVLWIGTELGGVNLLENQDSHFKIYRHDPENPSSLSSNWILSILEDRNGVVWVGTFGGGLNRFDRATQSFTHYTTKDGLPDDTVYGILADTNDAIWLSTNKGLAKFDPGARTFRNYDSSDGLQGDQFNPGAFSERNGEMFFGGTQGLNAFYPEQVTDNPIPPPVVITTFQKFNRTIQTDLASDETIHLAYQDSFISFEFAALDYNAPEKNLYAYQLTGVDKDWVYAGARRYTSYTNLHSGDYVFRVKASNNDGVWNSEGITIRIRMTPPFWQTWWFIGTAGLVTVLCVFGGYRLRVRGIEARNRDLANRVEQRTHELEALNAIAFVVSRSLDLTEIMSAALDKTLVLTGMEMGVAYRLEEGNAETAQDNRYLNSIISRGVPEVLVQPLSHPLFHGIMTERGGLSGQIVVWRITENTTLDIKQALESEGFQLGISVPLLAKENVVGAIFLATRTLRQVKPDELDLLAAISRQVGLAAENARLYEQAEQTASLTERSRLARELHDSVTQLLYSVTLYAEAAAELLATGETETAADHLRELRDTAQEALREMRLLIFELRPPGLEKGGLAASLQARLEAVEGRSGLHTEMQVEGTENLSRSNQVELYNIAREALNNTLKHAHAHNIRIKIRFEEAVNEMVIHDDGVGFEPANDQPGGGFGISGMKERAQKIGGILQINSAPGKGTEVIVQVPVISTTRPVKTELRPTWNETEA